MLHRRKFLENSLILAGGAAFIGPLDRHFSPFSGSGVSASDTINIGVIGINGMGWSNVLAALKIPGVRLVAICDVDERVISKRLGEYEKAGGDTSKIRKFSDYRELLGQKDIDAVIIGTPDHWHALMMIHACEAGKHVYVEKPVGNSIVESNRMVAAQKRYGTIVQAGQWQRSQQHFTDAIAFVHSGKLGNIRTVKVWCYIDWKQPLTIKPDAAVPAGVNYAAWLGPARKRAFNENRFHFTFRWFWDYAGGLMTDWGVHLLDYALLGMKADVPKSITALGGKFAKPDSADETPDTLMALYDFGNFNLSWDHAIGIGNGSYNRDHGIAFIGNNGTLVLNRGGWEVLEEKRNEQKVLMPFSKSTDNGLDLHFQNFVAAIRSGNISSLNCPISAAAHVANLAQMGNIAFRSGKKLDWDRQKGKFRDEEVNKDYLASEYHNGYVLPRV